MTGEITNFFSNRNLSVAILDLDRLHAAYWHLTY
jgi:hypothetical protein